MAVLCPAARRSVVMQAPILNKERSREIAGGQHAGTRGRFVAGVSFGCGCAALFAVAVVISGGSATRLSPEKFLVRVVTRMVSSASESNRWRRLANSAIATVVASLAARPLTRGGSPVSTTREFSEG